MNGNELNVDGFIAKLSADSKKQKIESGIAKLYPGERCGKAECMEKSAAVFEVASQMGMDIKALMQNCLKNEIMPVCGCMPVPFRDYERHPLKKCRFGFYYGEHPDKTDEQLEAASRRRKEARKKEKVEAMMKHGIINNISYGAPAPKTSASGNSSMRKQYDNVLAKIRKNEALIKDKSTSPENAAKYRRENEALKKQKTAIETRVDNAAHVIYSESASLRPQKGRDGKPDPASVKELQKARAAIGEISERGEKTYKTQPIPDDPISKKAWKESQDAAWKMGNSTSEKEKHYYFYNPDRKPIPQPINPVGTVPESAQPTKVFGPFINTSPKSDSGKGSRIQIKIYKKENKP